MTRDPRDAFKADEASRLPLDALPATRMRCLAAACCLPLAAVVFRLADVQQTMAARDATDAVPLRARVEPIDARDGTVTTADGRPLAADVTAFELRVDYRWLESEPDREWLDRQARRLVKAGEAADRPTAREILARRRDQLWAELAALTGDERRLAERRAAVERRVTRVRDDVERRRNARTNGSSVDAGSDRPFADLWRRLVGTGRATRPEKLVIAEELQSHAVATISREQADSIVADPGRFPGVDVREGRRRAYAASAPVHLLGTRLAATGVDATRGGDGIERIFDAHLAGVPGERVVRTDRDGGVTRVEPVRDPLPGHDLILTIDGGLQAAVAAACDELVDRGAAVVLDVDSGAVLAIASRPAFDAEAASARDTRFWDTIGGRYADPLFDRALNGRYRAGPIVAPFVVAAAVDAGVVGAESQFFCGSPGGEADDHPCPIVGETGLGHGTVTLRDAISLPCVASLAALSDALAEEKPEHPLAVFGFGEDYETDLPHRAAGVLSTERAVGSRGSRFRHRLGTSRVTPLEMARAAAALAGGGRLPTPHVVRGLGVRVAAGTRATVPAVT
ncbi:MAG: penicillin-binding transpeptidase domain-containing protein, partial [Planctomycetota bacterium]